MGLTTPDLLQAYDEICRWNRTGFCPEDALLRLIAANVTNTGISGVGALELLAAQHYVLGMLADEYVKLMRPTYPEPGE